ncbi:hypothetical protein [Crocinitomix catalasitica]|uniref:hypothetical protein n=1 Tax=Crocinitomix catalasitica TaxID=184607 RepID=UPI000481CECA|nr:hypothetical protein [Crocinitomix catalasitica]
MKNFLLLSFLFLVNTTAIGQEDEYDFNYDTITFAFGVELGYGFAKPIQYDHNSEYFFYSNGAGRTASVSLMSRFSYRKVYFVASLGFGMSNTEQTYVIGTLKDLSIGHTFNQKTQNILGEFTIGRKFNINETTDLNLGIGLGLVSENFTYGKPINGNINSLNSHIDNHLETDDVFDESPGYNIDDMTYNYELKINQPFQVAPIFLAGIETKLKKGSILLACDISINNMAYSTVVKYSGNNYSAFANTKYVASTFGVNLTYYFR